MTSKPSNDQEQAAQRYKARQELRTSLWRDGITLGVPRAQNSLVIGAQGTAHRAAGRGLHLIVALGVPVQPDGSIGPSLWARIRKTAELAYNFPDAHIFVSGAGVQNRYGEAVTMAAALASRFLVPPARISIETHATTTVDNAAFVWQELAAQSLPQPTKLTIVAEPYHSMRSLRIFATLTLAMAGSLELNLASTERVPLTSTFKRSPRAAVLQHLSDTTLLELDRCIEEKRRAMCGW